MSLQWLTVYICLYLLSLLLFSMFLSCSLTLIYTKWVINDSVISFSYNNFMIKRCYFTFQHKYPFDVMTFTFLFFLIFKTLSYWLHALPVESHKNLWFVSAVAVRNVFIEDHKREWSQLKKKYTKLKRDKNNVPLILLVVKLIFSLILLNTFFLEQPGIKPFNSYNNFFCTEPWTVMSQTLLLYLYI